MSGESQTYDGVADTLEDALRVAHGKISFRSGHDYTTSRVVDWGMQFGGFAGETLFYVRIEEDPDAPFKTKS
ncbi:hypothetical protein [Rhizobium hidalgonense]|uniref:Uncharacterized protein n=1 Tax=Rhizobium hidalgonense TaxID=1538159 RepID=A0ABX4JPA1_9HYPH|nr:hypothetical protein [Rhizobium hidalgonense]PDT21900.1 hypothetical protein CO674_20020 [Rhizobium hidalgonense]PON08567.1 hypothetical protein ATY29_05725 [Rhizobium hidalgonense]